MLNYSSGVFEVIPYILLAVILFRIVCRWRIFKRLSLKPWLSLIPVVSEYKIFKRCWKVWPYILIGGHAILFAVILITISYTDINLPIPFYVKNRMLILMLVCIAIIRILMYKRLALAFGHDTGFLMGLLFIEPVFLGLLAFSKNTFQEDMVRLSSKELRAYAREHRTLTNKILTAVSIVIVIWASLAYVADVMYAEYQPAFFVNRSLSKTYDATEGKVSGKGQVIYPSIESGASNVPPSRDLYFPDKTDVSETTVYMYLIGSNLEESIGSASINLAQIKDATAAGSNLKFIIEAGGTARWFTEGFKNGRTARYMIKNGKVTLLDTLPKDTCMSEPKTLEAFLKWANEKYPSDRRMLFFWDHGGGISGFGIDNLYKKHGHELLSMSDIKSALDAGGHKYDLVAFDACLMQTMEVGECLEPYADYLLASEENEPNSGMYYTAAFSRLATEPDLDTLKFGAMMCSSYDQSLELLNGSPQAGYTLSMVDLRYIPVAQETFIGYLDSLDEQFRTDRDSFIDMSQARSKAYEFQMKDQIDLIDYIYQSDIPAYEKNNMISKINEAIAVRSAASADHINGLAVYMPYDDLYSYTEINETMEELGMKSEVKVYNDFASIIGSQKTSKGGQYVGDFRKEKWYVDDFENYDSSLYLQDIPLTKKGDKYEIGLTDEQWDTITGYTLGLKMKVGTRYADMGSDDLYDLDENGHYMLEFDDTWVAINDIPVALHPQTPKTADENTVIYSGTVDAMMNLITPITIYIQWVNHGDEEGPGEILGYLPADEDADDVNNTGMQRGYKQFKSNNIVTFRYDWYDKEGNYLSTASGHRSIRVGSEGLRVSQEDISSQTYTYYGILQDAMHRTMQTEKLRHKGK